MRLYAGKVHDTVFCGRIEIGPARGGQLIIDLLTVGWGRYGGIELLSFTRRGPNYWTRGLLDTCGWEIWSLLWLVMPAQIRATRYPELKVNP